MPYDMFLSCNTTGRLSKPKVSTQIEKQCPKCFKNFQRLDLHLRRSATCSPSAQTGEMKPAQQLQQQQHSGPCSWRHSVTEPHHNILQYLPMVWSTRIHPPTQTTKRPIKIPRTKDKQVWQELNIKVAREIITPTVFEARSLEDRCEALTEGIYHLFAERCNLVSPQARKSARVTTWYPQQDAKETKGEKKRVEEGVQGGKEKKCPKGSHHRPGQTIPCMCKNAQQINTRQAST